MADIALSRTHAATLERLREAVGRVAEDADLYGLFSEWKGEDRLVLTGKGVRAVVDLSPETLAVTVTLPWLFRLVKGVIEGEVESKMQAVVAQAEA
jgi:putative polyhydroxyalkanoate system protein